MTTRLKINFLLPAYYSTPIGGYKVVYDYANFLVARGHEVAILFPREVQLRAGRTFAVAKDLLWAIRMRLRHRPLVPWHRLDPRIHLKLVPHLAERWIPDADVSVATGWQTAKPVADLSDRKGRKFYLIQGHETWAGNAKDVEETWRLPLNKIVISRWLYEIGERLSAENMKYIPNGIDLDIFKVSRNIESRGVSILTLYHTSKMKGVDDAISALQVYHEMFPQVPVAMFGTPARGDEIPDWIEYHEGLSGERLAALYNEHSVYLNASLTEGWALTPAEAMACGCAFVGTDSGGVRDFAIEGRTALLSEPRRYEHLLDNLIRITEDRVLREQLQREGGVKIREFTLERAGLAMEEYLLGGPPAPPPPARAVNPGPRRRGQQIR